MSAKKAYPLRINSQVLDAIQRWADDDLRSVNAQIEYLLREALRKSGRLSRAATADINEEPPACTIPRPNRHPRWRRRCAST